ncbi:hypothetical protein ACE38W_00505 [Chitinophaga sp. Hz27]|uniref:hypothetical protein n=1 Tax=Chitinophaga sp. Hz27 TaxID=3347169 RepID=UPI0035E108B2
MNLIEIQRGGQQIIEAAIKAESRSQGHYLTGSMEASLSGTIENTGNEKILTGTANGYTIYVNGGVPAKKIPYAPGSGAKTSQYITGLMNYWRLRGLSEEEAKRAAFATANVHKKQGMPTAASTDYSSTGERTKMIERAFEKKQTELDNWMTNGFDQIVEEEFQKTKSETV